MRIIPIEIKDEYIIGANAVIGAAHSHDDVCLRMKFGAMWDATAMHITWLDANGDNPTLVYITADKLVPGTSDTYDIAIPAEAKAYAGKATMSVKGAKVSGTTETSATLTATVQFIVLESVYDANAEESEAITPSVADQLQAQISAITTDIAYFKAHRTDAEAWAVGKRDNVDVTSSDATYHNNAKYYKEESASSASSASSSASSASASASTATEKASEASASASSASASATSANTAKTAAETAETNAETAQASAEAAAERAEAAAEEAEAMLEVKEDKSNKVTSVDSSSTDTQYPSAKLLYDELIKKVDKVSGKGLSENDYSDTEKQKVADAYSEKHTHDNKAVLDGITSGKVSEWNGKQNTSSNSLETTDKSIVGAINETNSLAKGKSKSEVYGGYSAMVTALNASSALSKGDNIYIVQLNIPDLWVAKVETNAVSYTYTTDEALIQAITGDVTTTLQIGYYRLCKLEGDKVDLTNVVKSTSTIETSGSGNVVTSLTIDANGNVTLNLGVSAIESSDTATAVLNSGITAALVEKLNGIEEGADVTDATNVSAAGAEMTANKTTSISASSTNTQYPSAKAVYDNVKRKVNTLVVTISNDQTGTSVADKSFATIKAAHDAGYQIVAKESTQESDNEYVLATITSTLATFVRTAPYISSMPWVVGLSISSSNVVSIWSSQVQGKLSEQNKLPYAYISGVPSFAETFTVTFTGEYGGPYVSDKTPAEIKAAFDAGKVVKGYIAVSGIELMFALAKYDSANGKAVMSCLYNDGDIATTTIMVINSDKSTTFGGGTPYVKPYAGIPSTDMSSAVRESLGKADASQPKNDNTLATTDKTVVGAINEIKGDLVNLDNAKVDKVQGKGLSTNDFDNTEKAKADGAVRFDTAMGLSDAQKLQARANIGILATLTVSCKPSEVGDSTVLSGVAVTIKDGGDNTIASGTFNGTALTFPLPINQQYKVVVSATVSIGGVVYFNPQGVGSEGTMTTDKTVVMEYASTRNIQTMADVKTFLALDLPIETKRNALVASETNSFTFNVDLYENGTEVAKTATMPMRVLEVDTYEQMVDGETVSFVGAKCQPIYTVTDKVFDQREQVETSAGETFTADLRYFTATTGGVGDKAFTMLTAGTDYQVGDDIDTYKTAHNVFVYKNGLRNNSNQLSADASVVRYGSNITHLSNVHKWLNGEGLDWFESSYVGDICNYSGTLGYKSWFKSDALSLIRDNVAWGVYERSGYELPNNKMYCMFALPSVTEFAGSGNSYEGTVTEYWKYLNGGAISNAANATRVIKNSGGTNKYMWFRSPSRSYSYSPWFLVVSGYCNYYGASNSFGVAPLFVI